MKHGIALVAFLALCLPVFGAGEVGALRPGEIELVPAQLGLASDWAGSDEIDAEVELRYHDNNVAGTMGISGGGTSIWAARITPDADYTLTAVRYYQGTNAAATAQIRIYGPNTTSAPGAQIYSQNFTRVENDWNRVDLTPATPIELTAGEDVWVGIYMQAAGDPRIGRDAGPAVANRSYWYWAMTGNWYASSPFGGSWPGNMLITAIASDGGGGDPTPTLTGIDPNEGEQGETNLLVDLTGTNFEAGMTVAFDPADGITVNNQASIFLTEGTARANITIDGAAAATARSVTVTTTEGTSNAMTFTVLEPPPPPPEPADFALLTPTFNAGNVPLTGAEFTWADASPDAFVPDAEEELRYHDGNFEGTMGINGGGTSIWGVRITPDKDYTMTAVRYYQGDFAAATAQIRIYGPGTEAAPGAQIHSQDFTRVTNAWNRVDLNTPIELTADEDVWVGIYMVQSGSDPRIGRDVGPAVANRSYWYWPMTSTWYSGIPMGGPWPGNMLISAIVETEPEVGYELYLTAAPGNPRDMAEPTVADLATPEWTYDLVDDLLEDTQYNWDVKAILDGVEKWSNTGFTFSTGEPPSAWVQMELMPADPGDRRDAVGRGSWLAYDAANNLIYAAKGQRNQEVHVFDPAAGEDGEWLAEPLAVVPVDTIRPRPVDRGSRGVVADGWLYVIHGNNTSLFWRYPLNGGGGENPWTPWERLEDIPLENSGRPVRGGGDLVYDADANAIYLLKGDRTDFLRYAISEGEWTVMTDAPADPPRWLRDSWLAIDDDGVIYAHKARYFDRDTEHRNDWAHYMYSYNGIWSEDIGGMPLLGPVGRRSRRRRSGEGASGAFYGGNLYALKGGNTQQLWQYDIAGEAWLHLEEMPLVGDDGRRRVNAGGYLISDGDGMLYALKGNRSNQFWRYTLPPTGMLASAPRPDRSGVMADDLPTGQAFVKLGPNPLSGGMATLRYSLPQAGPAQVTVFDVTGRSVLSRSIATSQTGAVSLDLRNLASGIYLLQVEADGFNSSQKLVVQR